MSPFSCIAPITIADITGIAAAASARTDDRGEYRVHGLEPGSYYVAALYQAPPRPSGALKNRRAQTRSAIPCP